MRANAEGRDGVEHQPADGRGTARPEGLPADPAAAPADRAASPAHAGGVAARRPGSTGRPAAVLALQALAGNRAVNHMITGRAGPGDRSGAAQPADGSAGQAVDGSAGQSVDVGATQPALDAGQQPGMGVPAPGDGAPAPGGDAGHVAASSGQRPLGQPADPPEAVPQRAQERTAGVEAAITATVPHAAIAPHAATAHGAHAGAPPEAVASTAESHAGPHADSDAASHAESDAVPDAGPAPDAPEAGQLVAPPLALPRPADPGGADVYDELVAVDEAGQVELATAVSGLLASQRATVDEQATRLTRAESAEIAAVGRAVSAARQRVSGAVATAQGEVAARGATQQAALAASHQQQQARAGQVVSDAAASVRRSGATRGDEAVTAAADVATGLRGNVGNLAQQARARGTTRAGAVHHSDSDTAEAMRRAIREVAGQTATEVQGSLGTTADDLRAVGPEVRQDLRRQADELAGRVARQTEPAHRDLAATTGQAAASLGRAAQEGSASIAAIGSTMSNGFTQLERTVRQSIRHRSSAGRAALGHSARVAEGAITDAGARAAHAGRDATAATLAQVTSRPVRRQFARQIGGMLTGHLQDAYGLSAGKARAVAGQIAGEFTRAAQEVHQSIQEAGEAGRSQARQMGSSGTRQAGRTQERIAQQLTTLMAQAAAQGDRVVAGTEQAVGETAGSADRGFLQAVQDLRTRLQQHSHEAESRAGQPLSTLDGRMRDAEQRARRRMEDGWLLTQLRDAWEALTPGFIAGLIVGLLVTIAVIALLGTGIGALILAGALAGALSALASNATDYACGTGRYAGNRPWNWGEVGREMFWGAVFGAAGGALGAGATGAVTSRMGTTLLQSLSRSAFSRAATQAAAAKASNFVVGVGLGIAQNVATEGWDAWDRGLLLNIAVNAVMVSGPMERGLQHATEGARATAVDRGFAHNVTPAEMAGAQARLAGRAGVEVPVDAPAAGRAGGDTATTEAPGRAGGDTATTEAPAATTEAPVATTEAPAATTEAPAVAAEPPTPIRDQVDRATGVNRGAEHEQAMAELRDFYANQQREAANVADVRGTRIDQMIDPATGQPMVNPDGSPYGYGIQQGFEVRRFDYGPNQGLTEVTVKVHLDPQAGVTPADIARVQADTLAGVDQHYNSGHSLPNGDRLHVGIEFVADPADAHLNVRLESGQGGAVQNRWFVESDPTVHAHELGHQLGLLDEYIDPGTVNRGGPGAAGVHTDGSLMGDFWGRDATGAPLTGPDGLPVADPGTRLHDRHLSQLGGDIDAARGVAPGGAAPAAHPPHDTATPATHLPDGTATPAVHPPDGAAVPEPHAPTATQVPPQLEAAGRALTAAQELLRQHPELEGFRGEVTALADAYWARRGESTGGGYAQLDAFAEGYRLRDDAQGLLNRMRSQMEGAAAFDSAGFQERLRRLPAGQRRAHIQEVAERVATGRGWEFDARMSDLNSTRDARRRVYYDAGTDRYYSVDFMHGTFEECDSTGRHVREVDFNLGQTDPRDESGGHDLRTR